MGLLVEYVLPFLGIISALVLVHEMGHYLAARSIGIEVTHFSLGMGPLLFSYRDRRGCRWEIRCLPIGGFVRMLGDADISSRPPEPGSPDASLLEQRRKLFHERPPHHRAWVIAAGPLANFLAGIAIVTAVYCMVGRPYTPPVIGSVVSGTPAEAAGFKIGDRILSVAGSTVSRFEDFASIVSMYPDTPIRVRIERIEAGEGREVGITVVPAAVEVESYGIPEKIGRIGVIAGAREIQDIGPLEAVRYGVVDSFNLTVTIVRGLGEILIGARSLEDLGGPVRVAEISGNAAKASWIAFVLLAAAISINLGVVNLLPIPILDGGHLVMHAIEAIKGRPPSPTVMQWAYKGGLAVILAIFVFVTLNDVAGLLRRHDIIDL